MYKLQCIQNKIKNKLHMKVANYTCFKQEEKNTRRVKRMKTILSMLQEINSP